MNIFIDTEFTDLYDIDLISIGLVAEDGREFYAERDDFDVGLCNEFVRHNILATLRAPGAIVMSRPALQTAVSVWLAQFADREPVICYDNGGDWALLYDLYDNDPPAWLRSRSVWADLDPRALHQYFVDTGEVRHHALHDARANAFAYRAGLKGEA